MARLWSSGFELNSLTDGVEFTSHQPGMSVVTSPVRSGTYACKVDGTQIGQYEEYQFKTSNDNGPFFFRTYLLVSSAPNIDNDIFEIDSSSNASLAWFKLKTDLTLQLVDEDGTIGSPSSVLSLNTWYRLEIGVDMTGAGGAHVVEGRLNGTVVATSSTRNISLGMTSLIVGGGILGEPINAGVWYFDDLAINDTTGSHQNSWPGEGGIVHLHPNAAGDSNGFLVQTGGTAGAANNFTRVNEITPDNATTYNGSAVLSAEDLFNCGSVTLPPTPQVNVVAVGVRMADLVGTDNTAAFKVELEKTASGTKSQSGTLIPNSTTWITNAATNPRNYPLTTYQDPDGTAWTQSTLDSMQIGYIQTATNIQTIAVSSIWALVEYTQLPGTITPMYLHSLG